MLTFKEFVFASWDARKSYAPAKEEYEKHFQWWSKEHPSNGWWVRYQAWKDHGCPMPVKDVEYEKLPKVVQVHDSVVVPTMTLEEFYAEKLNYVMNSKYFQPADFNTEKEDSKEAWKVTYNDWVSNGCPTFVYASHVKQPAKKQIRYLNRVECPQSS